MSLTVNENEYGLTVSETPTHSLTVSGTSAPLTIASDDLTLTVDESLTSLITVSGSTDPSITVQDNNILLTIDQSTGSSSSATNPFDQDLNTTDSPTFAAITVSGTVDGRDLSVDGTKLDGIAAQANKYVHPTYTSRSINTSGASVLDEFTSDVAGHVTNITTRTLTLADLGYTGAADANKFVHPTETSRSISVSATGAEVVDAIGFTSNALGHVTSASATKRTLTLADLGYTGATNADVTPSWVPSTNPNYLTAASTDLDSRYYTETETNGFLNLKANLASPTFTGAPKAPTPTLSDNSTNVATTEYVKGQTIAYSSLSGKPTIPSGNQIIDWTQDQGSTEIHAGNYINTDTLTSLALTSGSLVYTAEDGAATSISLAAYLDEDSRAIASGVLNAINGVVTFTRDDSTTFTLNLAALLDNTNLVASVAGKSGVVTLDKGDVGLGNVTNESKATMFASPTFTGAVSGVTKAHVGLGNVTNESKATMFASPTFTGNVGIGTTSPDRPLHIIGQFAIDNSTSPSGGLLISPDGNSNKVYSRTGNASTTAHPLDFISGSSTSMRIAANGDVGIGTTSPSNALEISNASFADQLRVLRPQNTEGGIAGIINIAGINSASAVKDYARIGVIIDDNTNATEDGSLVLQTITNGTNTEKVRINSSGNVGIGTNSPAAKLHIGPNTLLGSYTSTRTTLAVSDTANGAELILRGQSPRIWFDATSGGMGEMYLDTVQFNILSGTPTSAGASRFYIKEGGNVGIGTTSPSEKFHVSNGASGFSGTHNVRTSAIIESDNSNGTALAIMSKNTGNSAIWFGDQNSETVGQVYYNHPSNYLAFGASGATQAVVNSTGLGIGTTGPDEKLHINGSVNGNVKALIQNTNSGSSAYATLGFQNNLPHSVQPSLFLNGTNNTNYAGANSLNMYQHGSYNLGFVTNNTLRMVVAGGGNVGIGTTSPAVDLQIGDGSAEKTLRVFHSDNTYTQISGYGLFMSRGSSYIRPTADNSKGLYIGSSNYQWNLIAQDATNHTFSTNGSESVRITSSGNVGIGTTNPTKELQVVGEIKATSKILVEDSSNSRLEFASSISNQARISAHKSNLGQTLPLLIQAEGIKFGTVGGGEKMRMDANGNVGIGTTTPDEKLDIVGKQTFSGTGTSHYGNPAAFNTASNGDKIIFYNDGTSYDGRIGVGSTSNLWLKSYGETANEGDIEFYAGGSNRAIIKGDGKVGIGTTSPAGILEIAGNTDTNSNFLIIRDKDPTAGSARPSIRFAKSDGTVLGQLLALDGTNQRLQFSGDNTQDPHLTVYNNGNVGIGTTSPTSKLHVSLPNQALGFNSSIFASANPSDYTVGRGSGITFQNADVYTGGVYGIREANNWTGALAFYTHTSSANNTFGSTFTEKMRILANGNVGIGTASPTEKLHISSATTTTLAIQSGSNNAEGSKMRLTEGATYNGGFIHYDGSANALKLGVHAPFNSTLSDDTTAITIPRDTGNVGIGVTDPDSKLEIKGSGTGSGTALRVRNSSDNELLTVGDNGIVTVPKNYFYVSSGGGAYVQNALRVRGSLLNDQGTLSITGDVSFDSYTLFVDSAYDRVGVGSSSPSYKLEVNGGILAGGKVTYHKSAGSLDTTGYAVAGLTSSYNGDSAGFTFTCYGHAGGYQRIVYACHNVSGTTWNTQKVIDEGTNDFDVVASANGSTITFTFKSRSGTKSYTPRVVVEAAGGSINNTYA